MQQVADEKPKQAWGPETAPAAKPEGSTAKDGPSAPAQCKPEDKIPCCRKLIFSAPTMATLPFVAMWGMYGNKNYQAFGASLAMIGLFTALARSFDVVSDPLVSYWTDSSECGKLPAWLRGRRKPFMFFGCFFYATFLWLLLNPPYWSQTPLSIWFGATYSLYFLSNTLTTIPYDALGPELSEDSAERTGLFFVSNNFDGVGTLIALGLPIAMEKFSADYTDRNGDICKTDLERAELCLASRSCNDFFDEGWDAAFRQNGTLQVIFTDLTNTSAPPDAARKCIKWLRSRASADRVLFGHSTAAQNDAFCECMGTCGDGCDVANKRTGFMLVGYIFAIWFVVTMVIAVIFIPERPLDPKRPKSPPILPSMRSALSNRPFCILLPAWLCDAFVTALTQSLVPFFVEAVVAPAYQTQEDHGRDCSPSSASFENGKWIGKAGMEDSEEFDRLCNTNNVIAICGLSALVTAILVLPIWFFVVRKVGKVRAWLLWSVTMACTNILFVFVFKGQVYFLIVAAALNGAPLGAKFLADAVLADIIDYDEFLSGMRSEATYFMFKSFLPKIVQIPTSAIPIVLLDAFGYRQPVGGRVQDQPASASTYIRCVVGLGFVMSVCAFFLKLRYPLHEAEVEKLKESLEKHKDCQWGDDPISKRPYKPMGVESEEEQEAFWLFNHFSNDELQTAFVRCPVFAPQDGSLVQGWSENAAKFNAGCKNLRSKTVRQLVICIVCFVVAGVGTGVSMQLIDNAKLAFIPTLCVVAVGLGIAATGFCALRLRAARRLREYAPKSGAALEGSVLRLLGHQAQLAQLGRKNAEIYEVNADEKPLNKEESASKESEEPLTPVQKWSKEKDISEDSDSKVVEPAGKGAAEKASAGPPPAVKEAAAVRLPAEIAHEEQAVADQTPADKARAEKAAAEKAAADRAAAEKAAAEKAAADQAAAEKAAAEKAAAEKAAAEKAAADKIAAEKAAAEKAIADKAAAEKAAADKAAAEEAEKEKAVKISAAASLLAAASSK